jgi:hypothetical protein
LRLSDIFEIGYRYSSQIHSSAKLHKKIAQLSFAILINYCNFARYSKKKVYFKSNNYIAMTNTNNIHEPEINMGEALSKTEKFFGIPPLSTFILNKASAL